MPHIKFDYILTCKVEWKLKNKPWFKVGELSWKQHTHSLIESIKFKVNSILILNLESILIQQKNARWVAITLKKWALCRYESILHSQQAYHSGLPLDYQRNGIWMAFRWRVDSGPRSYAGWVGIALRQCRINIFWEGDRNVLATQKIYRGREQQIYCNWYFHEIQFFWTFFVPFYDVHFPSNFH